MMPATLDKPILHENIEFGGVWARFMGSPARTPEQEPFDALVTSGPSRKPISGLAQAQSDRPKSPGSNFRKQRRRTPAPDFGPATRGSLSDLRTTTPGAGPLGVSRPVGQLKVGWRSWVVSQWGLDESHHSYEMSAGQDWPGFELIQGVFDRRWANVGPSSTK